MAVRRVVTGPARRDSDYCVSEAIERLVVLAETEIGLLRRRAVLWWLAAHFGGQSRAGRSHR